jgi:integrase
VASFRKRGPYQWQAQVRKKGQPLQTKTFETRALAEQWARAIEVEMDKGVFISRAETRTVQLSTIAVKVLRALPRSLHGQVFPGLTTKAIKRAYIRAVRRAGIEDLRFHDLRHEATTRLFEKGLNIMEVASITGHKDSRMLRRYTHLKAEDLAIKLG